MCLSLIRRNADTRKFLLDAYEDDVRDIIDSIIANEDVDTDKFNRQQLFRMAVDIAKKRESYIPRKKKKSPSKNVETVDLTLSVSKVAAKVAAAALGDKKGTASPDNKDGSALDDELVAYDKTSQKMRTKMKDKLVDSSAKSPKKQTKAKTKTKAPPATNERGEVLKVGMKVQGKWTGEENYGEWFDGVVLSVNSKKKTIHIKYDDGDEDKSLSWHDVSIM